MGLPVHIIVCGLRCLMLILRISHTTAKSGHSGGYTDSGLLSNPPQAV